jgi:hypothetical protein
MNIITVLNVKTRAVFILFSISLNRNTDAAKLDFNSTL